MNKPTITFCGGVGSVTGANFLLETIEGKKILIDCGLVQGDKVAMEENRRVWQYEPSSIDALFITHAHLDHVGRIPMLVRDGFKGPIYSTSQTKELAEIVLNDAVRILGIEAEQAGEQTLYTQDDVDRIFPLWKSIDYHQDFHLTSDTKIVAKDAGHILGSAMYTFFIKSLDPDKQTKIMFTGDLGNSPAPLLRNTEEIGEVDYLVMESVYGDRNHEGKEGRENRLVKIINETVSLGGTVVIPAFAVDRTQIILYELNNMVEKKIIPDLPTFVDSPMAIKATSVYAQNTRLFNDKVQKQIDGGDDVFKFPRLKFTVDKVDSKEIDKAEGSKIILAGSGMSIGGRVIGHERKYLPSSKNTIILMGYQSVGSLGRELADGNKKVRINHETIKVKARIETLYGYSAHKDSDHLIEFLSTASGLKKVYVVMGEPRSEMFLAQRINDEFEVEANVPEVGQKVELI